MLANHTDAIANKCHCEFAQGIDETYKMFNFIIIVIAIPLVAMCGLVGNMMALLVYTRHTMQKNSVSVYLVLLALGDILSDLSGMLTISIDSARSYNVYLNWMHIHVIQYTLPLCYMSQMLSIYATILASLDCFVTTCCRGYKLRFCTRKSAFRNVLLLIIITIVYNQPLFWELKVVKCLNIKGQLTDEICPTELLTNLAYYKIYKLYMYGIFMTALPFSLLLILNSCIVYRLMRKSSRGIQGSDGDSAYMLVSVVALFLICNTPALAVNIIESAMTFDERSTLMYLIDMSNFLVVLNSSANFLIYLVFSRKFRVALVTHLCRLKIVPPAGVPTTSNGVVVSMARGKVDTAVSPFSELDQLLPQSCPRKSTVSEKASDTNNNDSQKPDRTAEKTVPDLCSSEL